MSENIDIAGFSFHSLQRFDRFSQYPTMVVECTPRRSRPVSFVPISLGIASARYWFALSPFNASSCRITKRVTAVYTIAIRQRMEET
jgi:hypothetical protein